MNRIETSIGLIRRDREVRALGDRIDGASRATAGEALLVRGEAGIGKSSLLHAAWKYAAERGRSP